METKRRNKVRAVGFAVLAGLIGMSGEAGAACVQTDLTGTWHAVGAFGNANLDGFEEYIRCKIVLNSAGTVVISQSTCRGRDNVGSFTVTFAGGSVRVSSACAITGNLVYEAGATDLRQVIEFGQMARDKNIFTFATYQNTNNDLLGLFTAVKQ